MANKVKKELNKRFEVNIASREGILLHKDLLKEIDKVTRIDHRMTSDEIPFSLYIGCSIGQPVVASRYLSYIKLKLEKAFGCEIRIDMFKCSLKEACDFITKNRTNLKVKIEESFFLGIKTLKNIETQEHWRVEHPFVLREHVDYFSGWIMGKEKPLNGPENMIKGILDDFEVMRKDVYEKMGNYRYEIQTEEGDLLRFHNLYEVSCWIIARASNYNPDSMSKENW